MIKKKKKLALFDLDDTLFDGDTEGEWVTFMHKNGFIEDSSFFNEMEKFEKNYREGILNVYDYSEFLLSPLTGVHLSEIKEDINNFTSDISERLTDNLTEELLEQHEHDAKILTSGSLSFLVTEIGKKLGIKTCFGTDPEYVDNIFTGKVSGKPNFSEEKVRRVIEWIGSENFDEISAYSDSIHDLPLLEFSDIPSAISPDKKLRKIAEERNWLVEGRRNTTRSLP